MFALFLARAASFDLQCKLCTTVADIAADMIAEKISSEEIKNNLIAKCQSLMPGFLKGLCDKVVTMPLNELIELLQAEQTPTKACCAIKMCKKVVKNRAQPRAVSNAGEQWSQTWEELI